jgi:hypothetical protein
MCLFELIWPTQFASKVVALSKPLSCVLSDNLKSTEFARLVLEELVTLVALDLFALELLALALQPPTNKLAQPAVRVVLPTLATLVNIGMVPFA